MKIYNLRRRIAKKIAAFAIAAGSFLGGAQVYAQLNHPVGDDSFDQTDVNASTYTDYAYIASGHVTAWEQQSGFNSGTFDSGWFYNSSYGQVLDGERPFPRTGTQAYHGSARGEYVFQELGDTYQAGRTYTLSAWIMGDGDLAEANRQGDPTWDFAELILYDGSVDAAANDITDPTNSLAHADFNWFNNGDFDLAPGNGTPPGGGTGTWTKLGVSHTVLAGAAEIGSPIGVAINHGNEVAFDDITVTSVPEPMGVLLCGLGIAGVLALRRRPRGR